MKPRAVALHIKLLPPLSLPLPQIHTKKCANNSLTHFPVALEPLCPN